MKTSTRFEPGKSGNPSTQWRAGQSGNPSGKPKSRRQFEQALADALTSENPAERAKELSDLLWAAARKGEAWAITMLFQRLAPEPLKIKMELTRAENEIDFSRLTDEQLDQLEGIFHQLAASPAGLIESGEGAAEPA